MSYSPVPQETPEFTGRPDGVSEELWNAYVAAGKSMFFLRNKAADDACMLETSSVYGAAVALPQIARTSGWALEYTAYAVRGSLFLLCNILVQGFCLYMVSKEERVNDKFGGQMHLCDFGADIDRCPDGPGCYGPGGTTYTPDRLYNWNMWANREFVRNSFIAMFPDRIDEINIKVDAGEYGLESYWLRFTCVLIFVMGLWPDLVSTFSLARFLYCSPNAPEPWLLWDEGEERQPQSPHLHHHHVVHHSGHLHDSRRAKLADRHSCSRISSSRREVEASHLERIKFRVAGMPLPWKLFNWVFVFIPKMYLWLVMTDAGTVFLMETSGIEDLIVNAVALSFILSIDELICVALFSDTVKHMLENLEQYSPASDLDGNRSSVTDDTAAWFLTQARRQWSIFTPSLYMHIFPARLFGILAVTVFFLAKYYREHCEEQPDGTWTAVDLHLPKEYSMSFVTFLFSPVPYIFPVETLKEAAWSFKPKTE